MLQKICDALDEIRAEELDYEILRAESDLMGEDVLTSWRPSLSYLPPEARYGDGLHNEDIQRVIHARAETPSSPTSIDWSRGLPALVNDYEACLIRKALEAHRQIDEVAKVLQISRSSLYKKIKDHDIDWKGE